MKKQSFVVGIGGFLVEVEFGESELAWYKQKAIEQFLEVWGEGGFLRDADGADYKVFVDYKDMFKEVCLREFDEELYLRSFNWDRKKRKIKISGLVGIAGLYFVLQRIVFELLKDQKGFVLHASLGEREGEYVAFMAPSGGGKSTSVGLYVKDENSVFADDSCVVRKEKGDWYFYSEFGVKKEYLPKSKKVKDVKMYFVKKGENAGERGKKQEGKVETILRSVVG